MSLRAIDISSWDAGIIPHELDCDIVIVKATGGTWYENPFFKQWCDDVIASGKMLGIYHYAVESQTNPSAAAEAEFFLRHVRQYRGRFVPILDWEADAMSLPDSWAREWCDIVGKDLGATPIFYAYASHLNSKAYPSTARKFPLWMASYLNRYDGAGWVSDPVNTWGTGSWSQMLMYQYTSTGHVAGGRGHDLDLSIFYGDAAAWNDLCGGYDGTIAVGLLPYGSAMAEVMEHVIAHNAHGYSQPNREGTGGKEVLTLSDNTMVTIHTGDFDCSSLIEECAEALGLLARDTWMWTGNECELLEMHGFYQVPLGQVERGDILWREGHTEMYLGNGLQGGARRSEYGTADGQTGDQDGYEICASAYRASDWTRAYRCGLTRPGSGHTIGCEDTMAMLIHPKDENKVYYWDGSPECVPYHVSGAEKAAVEAAYKASHGGAAIPFFEMQQYDFNSIMNMCKARKAWREKGIATAVAQP
jgi:GH25 family lysozyme M1 (1,4-beta-N-acetylmuramidase)